MGIVGNKSNGVNGQDYQFMTHGLMLNTTTAAVEPFQNPTLTAKGEERASVNWAGLKTLWLNTGTLCNIECINCYIKSSPKNDDLIYLTLGDVTPFLDEIDGKVEIGITGGEPFMAPEILDIMGACLARGHRLLVLTNAMQPMMRPRIKAGLIDLHAQYGDQMVLRVSLDHFAIDLHDKERGKGSFAKACEGLTWLAQTGITTHIAGRMESVGEEAAARHAYGTLAANLGLTLNPESAKDLVLFPEMVEGDSPPEISTACWQILGRDPDDIMCATQRMVIRRKGAGRAIVTACTLLPYDTRFDMGNTLAEATSKPVALNHPWCASFCVLGGASCSA